MDPRLQAGVELQVEKEAQQEHDSSLSGVLSQPFKKEAGWKSEVAGYANPVNWPGIPVAAVAAALTKTRTLREQAEADKETWKNILLPGRQQYNIYKREGHSARGPEIKAAREALKAKTEEEAAVASAAIAAVREAKEQGGEKEAGYWTELAGIFINPLLQYGTLAGGATAALTKTRDIEGQAKADRETWKNFLIPGRAGYNVSKRFGHAIRGPEIKAERAALKAEDAEEEAAAAHAVAALRDKNEEAEGNAPEEKQASVTAGRVLSTMLRGINHA